MSEEDGEPIVQQRHQKMNADPSGWYQSLLEGATLEQLRLEERIKAVRRRIRRLDLIAIVLTVISTSAIMASLGDLFPNYPKLPIVIAGIMNLVIALTVALKGYSEDNGVLFRYETLHDEFGSFFADLINPELRKAPTQIAKRMKALQARIVRIAPEIRSSTGWDNMTDAEREQYLQQRIAQ